MNVLERIKKQELTVLVGENYDMGSTIRNSLECSQELIKLAEIGQQMQWVSVNDRLPNFNGKIIACSGGEKVMGCSFNNDAKEFFHIQNIKNVTHWMPLPNKPI